MTHRGIGLDNVFQAAPGQSVVLGTAWAAPPAMASRRCSSRLIPRCACLPAVARAASPTMSDPLGVLLLCLALGRVPLGRADDATHPRGASSSSAPSPHWRATTACRRSSATWRAACPPRIPSIGHRLPCCSTRRMHAAAASPLGRRAGRSVRHSMAGIDVWDARSLVSTRWPSSRSKRTNALRGGSGRPLVAAGLGDGVTRHADSRNWCVTGAWIQSCRRTTGGEATLVMRAIARSIRLRHDAGAAWCSGPMAWAPRCAATQTTDPDTSSANLQEIGRSASRPATGPSCAPSARDSGLLRVDVRQQQPGCQLRGPGGR